MHWRPCPDVFVIFASWSSCYIGHSPLQLFLCPFLNFFSLYEGEKEKGSRKRIEQNRGVVIESSVDIPFLHKNFQLSAISLIDYRRLSRELVGVVWGIPPRISSRISSRISPSATWIPTRGPKRVVQGVW